MRPHFAVFSVLKSVALCTNKLKQRRTRMIRYEGLDEYSDHRTFRFKIEDDIGWDTSEHLGISEQLMAEYILRLTC